MRTTRRNFLKGLLAVGAAALVPQALVEKVHGASDLTPQERDIAADVMGLRQEQWPGADLWHPKTMRRTSWADGAVMTDRIDDWQIEHGDLVMFQDAKTELLIDGEWRLVVDALNRMGQAAKSASHSFDALEHVWPSPEWEQDVLVGKPGGQMPAGVLSLETGETIVGVDSAARPSVSFPRDEMRDITAAFVRGSRMAADNLGVTLPAWSLCDDERIVGRMLLDSFDEYAEGATVNPRLASSIRHAIKDEWGLLLGRTRSRRLTVGDALAHRDTGFPQFGVPWSEIDNVGITIDTAHVNYIAALSKGKLVDSLTESEKRQAFMNELLRGDGTDVISNTTPTWGGDRA